MPNSHLTFCPACGAQGLEFVRKQFRCPTCHMTLFLNPGTAVAALIRNSKGELLVVTRAHEPQKGMWDLPGGFVDPGETAEQALVREIREELGVTLDNLSYLFSTANLCYLFKGITYQTTDLAFEATIAKPETITAADDVQDTLWIALEDMDFTRFGFESIRQIVRQYITASNNSSHQA